MDQPQKRRSPQRQWTAEMRAAHSVRVRRQHAERRGWSIRPELMAQYVNAYGRLSDHGVSRDEIYRQLRPLYAEEG